MITIKKIIIDQKKNLILLGDDDKQYKITESDSISGRAYPVEQKQKLATGKKYAVTHGGVAHTDEFLAACLLAYKFGLPILRRNPTPEELENPNIIIFDVGGKYEPEKNNYDHHQDPKIPCSLYLITKHFFPKIPFAKSFPWWDAVDFRSRKSTPTLAQKYGLTPQQFSELALSKLAGIQMIKKLTPQQFSELVSPIQGASLRMFAQTDKVQPAENIYEIMWEIGKTMVVTADQFKDDWFDVIGKAIKN